MDELVAQLVEQYTFNVWALGSSPSQFTKTPEIFGSFFIRSINCIPLHQQSQAFPTLQNFHLHAGAPHHLWQ